MRDEARAHAGWRWGEGRRGGREEAACSALVVGGRCPKAIDLPMLYLRAVVVRVAIAYDACVHVCVAFGRCDRSRVMMERVQGDAKKGVGMSRLHSVREAKDCFQRTSAF